MGKYLHARRGSGEEQGIKLYKQYQPCEMKITHRKKKKKNYWKEILQNTLTVVAAHFATRPKFSVLSMIAFVTAATNYIFDTRSLEVNSPSWLLPGRRPAWVGFRASQVPLPKTRPL